MTQGKRKLLFEQMRDQERQEWLEQDKAWQIRREEDLAVYRHSRQVFRDLVMDYFKSVLEEADKKDPATIEAVTGLIETMKSFYEFTS